MPVTETAEHMGPLDRPLEPLGIVGELLLDAEKVELAGNYLVGGIGVARQTTELDVVNLLKRRTIPP